MSRFQLHSARFLATLLVLLGAGVLVSTVARGGGPLSVGVLTGIVLMLFGAARIYLSAVMHEPR